MNKDFPFDVLVATSSMPRESEATRIFARGEVVRAADDLGYDGIGIPDHVINPETMGTPYPYTKRHVWPTGASSSAGGVKRNSP